MHAAATAATGIVNRRAHSTNPSRLNPSALARSPRTTCDASTRPSSTVHEEWTRAWKNQMYDSRRRKIAPASSAWIIGPIGWNADRTARAGEGDFACILRLRIELPVRADARHDLIDATGSPTPRRPTRA